MFWWQQISSKRTTLQSLICVLAVSPLSVVSAGRCIVCSNYPGSNLDLTSKSTNVADCLPGIEDVNPVVRLSKYSVDCYSHLGLSKEEAKVKLLCQAQFDVPQDKTAETRVKRSCYVAGLGDEPINEGHCLMGRTTQNKWPSCICSQENCNSYAGMQRLSNGTIFGLGFPSEASPDAVGVKSSAQLLARPVPVTIALLLYTLVLLTLGLGPGFVLCSS